MRGHWTNCKRVSKCVLLVSTIAAVVLAGCRLVQRRGRSESSSNPHVLGGHPWRQAAVGEQRETDLLWIG
jgi:hypothetical protein